MSARPLSLRRRVTIAFTVLGFILSLLFAAATVWMADDYESVLVEEILQGQAEDYGERLAASPDTPLPRTHRLSGYLRRKNGSGDVPAAYSAFAPGLHEPADEASGIHIGVFDTELGRLYFVIDLSDIEAFETHLDWAVAAVLVLGTALSGWLGWLLASRTLAPVRRLADAVDALPTQPQASALATLISDDGLGRLASAIDRYQTRLVEADGQERAFYADASHELRTPLAVVRGTAEVLLDEPTADAGMRRRLQRLDRGVQELTDLLDVLLGMARRREPQLETLDASALLREALSSLAPGSEPASVPFDIVATGELHLPRHESLLLLRSALRRVIPSDTPGRLQIALRGSAIELGFTPEHGSSASSPIRELPQRSDRGLSLTLAARLGEQLGWHFETPDGQAGIAGGLRVRLPDSAIVPGKV